MTTLYTPKGVFTYAALLRQASAHCAKFPTAASRRSLGRLSVPVWLIILSDQLPIIALVSSYPTNELIGRTPVARHQLACRGQLSSAPTTAPSVCGITPTFAGLSPSKRPVRYVFLTRLPCYSAPESTFRIRLACIKHAASVRSEPGSNSPLWLTSLETPPLPPQGLDFHSRSFEPAWLLVSKNELFPISTIRHFQFLSSAFLFFTYSFSPNTLANTYALTCDKPDFFW